MHVMFKMLMVYFLAAATALGAALPASDTAIIADGDPSNATSLARRWVGGTCSFHAKIDQTCYQKFLGSKPKHWTDLTFTKGILDGAGNEIPKLRFSESWNAKNPVKGTRFAVTDVFDIVTGDRMSIGGFADKVLLLFKWYEWKDNKGGMHEKMTYEYGCQWDEDVHKSDAKCGGWCDRGAWDKAKWPCDGVDKRTHEMDCYFKC
ncbi:hypothetical protein BDV96DRAFT_578421 [Lophiotrema nucula]|uniref:Uncharacterized protein n=1 Tax=Lophiotrema nucula TaxID=690887 RepID=A0A6A5Z315_9PLEO|nr:hypothetical protein BDV96DRAFT_578421 [Lophiotrema nucula]